MSKLRQRQRNIHTKRGHKDKAGIHTVCAWSEWEWSMQSRLSRGPTARIVSGFHCICFAPGENSLWGGSFLCSWESQMDQMEGMKTVEPHLLPFPSDPVPALWNRKPAPWFFPPEKGLDAPPVFFRGGWLGGCRWAFTKRNVCKSILWINIKQNKVIEKNISEERSSHTQLSREKKGGADCVFPAAIHCAPAGHAPRSVSVPMILQSGPTTAEALRRLRWRGSHMDLADGLETGSPFLHLHSPDLALSRGGSLCCSSSPLSESALICSSFSLQGDLYWFYIWVAHVLPRSLRSFPVHYMNLLHQTVFSCLGIWLHLILKN